MKLQTRETNTQLSGNTTAPRTFTINANDVAFGVLSSGLYNDKIRAIIRELACNAWDAHVMAGKKDVPFDIHLPTDLEPFFRITDYGTGLSHDDVMNLYCTYFASNKNQSNDVVGAMGLGSKSPFCYTQAQDEPQGFTVVSRFQNVKRIYSAYVEGGAPTIVCLSEEETTEPNGLEIQFAVNTEDVWEFENKAKKALEFFSPAPNVNIEGFEADRQEYAIKTNLWGLRKEDTFSGLRAIQGMVQYNVGSIDVSRMSLEQQQVSELPLDLFFCIGDLSVAASRETLSNDQRTINNILTMLTNIHTDMIEETRKTLDTCEYAWQARIKLLNVMNSPLGTMIRKAYNEGAFYGKYAKFTLTQNKPSLNELDFHTMQVTKFTRSGTKKAYRSRLFQPRTTESRQLALDSIAIDAKIEKHFLHEIEVDQNVVFVLNDLGIKGTEKYMHAYVQRTNDAKSAYVFSVANGKVQMKKMLKEFKKALDIIGNPPYITVSYLKENYQHLVDAMKPTPRPKATGVLELTGDGSSYRSGRNSGWSKHAWSRVSADKLPNGVKFYVPTEKRVLVDTTFNFYRASDFVEFINDVKVSKLFPDITPTTRVFGLTEKSAELKNNKKEWVNILDYVAKHAQASITDAKVLELSIHLEPFTCDHADALQAILRRKSQFVNSPLVEFAESYFAVKGQRRQEQAEVIARIINKLSAVGKYKRGEVVNFKSLWRKIVVEHYPMLGLGFSRYSRTDGVSYEDSVLSYVKLVDSQIK